jgi:hypothetical protein
MAEVQMAIAGFVIALVSLAVSVSAGILFFLYLGRLQRAYLTQIALMIGRIGEIEESVARMGEGGYLILRMLMEKGIIDEDEMERAWRLYVEEPRQKAREFAELVRAWKERAEKEGFLVEAPNKTAH